MHGFDVLVASGLMVYLGSLGALDAITAAVLMFCFDSSGSNDEKDLCVSLCLRCQRTENHL